ncbi:Nitroreductase [Alteromonadaceae bacterium Bs31]|nr:Nitroreductase [Alteromonadaceae bacterium Bs31]
MKVRDALLQRKSVRAFLNKDVEKDTITRILDAARHAPSGSNTQPWQVAVVSGKKKLSLQKKLENAHLEGVPEKMDYIYYPRQWLEPYKLRRRECGLQLYSTLNIQRDDVEKRKNQWLANYRAFDAPAMLYFFMDPTLETGSFMDYGMFLQSVMLSAEEEGLASCAQAALGQYPELVKTELNYDSKLILICGMALGYEDKKATVNSYRTPRESVASFTQFFE